MADSIRRVGLVEISKYDLAAKCGKCGKSMNYPKGTNMGMWKQMLRGFVKKHKECDAKT